MKKIIMMILIYMMCITVVLANEKYVNENGVNIPIGKYNELLEVFPKNKIERMTQTQYDKIKDRNLKKISEEKKYYATHTLVNNMGMEIISFNEEVTEDEYYNSDNQILPMSTCTIADVCWETDYKMLYLNVFHDSGSNEWGFLVGTFWKEVPKCRSYDVIAIRFDGIKVTDYSGFQGTWIDGYMESAEYNSDNKNFKAFDNGVGLSMNLFNDGYNYFDMELDVDGIATSNSINVYATYQHAKSNLTLAQSQSYTLSQKGLGQVLYYSNSTIKNTYDNMQGVSISGLLVNSSY